MILLLLAAVASTGAGASTATPHVDVTEPTRSLPLQGIAAAVDLRAGTGSAPVGASLSAKLPSRRQERYCPSAEDLTVAYAAPHTPSLQDRGWTFHGGGGVATKSAFNLLVRAACLLGNSLLSPTLSVTQRTASSHALTTTGAGTIRNPTLRFDFQR